MSNDTVRVFIAIELISKIREKLGQLIESLKNKGDRITWVKKQNLHVTMVFLGNIPLKTIDTVKNIVSETAEIITPFDISVESIGVFPSTKSPRIIWAGVKNGAEKITGIYTDLKKRLPVIGFKKENRAFRPHITIGRIKSVKNLNKFVVELQRISENKFGSMTVGGISLVKSTLTQQGSVYETLFLANFRTR